MVAADYFFGVMKQASFVNIFFYYMLYNLNAEICMCFNVFILGFRQFPGLVQYAVLNRNLSHIVHLRQ
jgi:hypothetical protein